MANHNRYQTAYTLTPPILNLVAQALILEACNE